MSEVLFFISLLFGVHCCRISKKKFGVWTNHYVYTNIWWFVTLTFSIFQNNYASPVSTEVYVIFFIGLTVFNTTVLTDHIQPFSSLSTVSMFSLKRRRIVEIIVLFAIVPIAYLNLMLLLSGEDLWRINDAYWHDETVRGSYWELFYKENVIEPISTILMATCFFNLYKDGGKYSYLLTGVIGISLAFLNMLVTGGGRTGLLSLAFILLLSFCASKVIREQKVMVNISTKFVLVVIVAIFIGIQFSSEGRGQDEGLLTVLIDRLTLAPALFEGWYQRTSVCDGYSLGTSMFETPLAILLYPLKFMGMGDFERISSIEQTSMFAPALGHNSNAAVTAYLYYMRDFGYVGVVLGPYIVAKIYNYLWKICQKDLFMQVFYLTAICLTCLETIYPFRRGFVFVIIFAFLYKRFTVVK